MDPQVTHTTAGIRASIMQHVWPQNRPFVACKMLCTYSLFCRYFASSRSVILPAICRFQCIVSLAKSFISGLIGDTDAVLNIRRIDEGGIDGDLCAVVTSPNLTVVCVVWPTAAKLKQLKKLSEVSAAFLIPY